MNQPNHQYQVPPTPSATDTTQSDQSTIPDQELSVQTDIDAESNTLKTEAYQLRYWNPKKRWYHPLICSSVLYASQCVMRVINRVEFHGKQNWEDLLNNEKVKQGRGILSFSNHVSLFDDPLLISSLGYTSYKNARWIAADHRNFFGNACKGIIFSAGKCVPIIRGAGLKQKGFDFLLDRLKAGDWVHIFPEGGRTRDTNGLLRTPFKLGIGRLIYEAQPMVIPFYHCGMQKIMPIGSILPRIQQKVQVYFGQAHDMNQAELDHTIIPSLTQESELSTLDSTPTSSHSSQLDYKMWVALTDWSFLQLQRLEKMHHPKFKTSS